MDIKQIKSIWSAWQEVQEKKAPVTKKDDDGEGMDPVGKADADIDNDGDTDSSDKYLAKRRKAIGKAMKKEAVEEDKSQFMYAAKQAKKKGDQEFVFAGKKYKTEDAYNMKEEDYPVPPKTKKAGDALEPVNNRTAKLKEEEGSYPAPKKVKKAGDALEPVNNRTAKLKEEDKEECPKCEGKGCSHCDDKGYHMKESSLDTSLFSEEELSILEKAAGEEFGSTASKGETKFYKDHQKSDPKLATVGDHENSDKAGKVTKQSAARNAADNLNNGDSKTAGKL